MLADDIIAATGSVGDRAYHGGFGRYATRIKQAQRFDLAPEVVRSASAILTTPLGPQLRAMSLARLPFRECWFEWPGSYLQRPSTRRDVWAPVPKRVGVLIMADYDLQSGIMFYAWNHTINEGPAAALPPALRINLCPLVVNFDWREQPEPVDDLLEHDQWHKTATEADWNRLRATFPRLKTSSRADVIDDHRRFGVGYNPMIGDFIMELSQLPTFSTTMLAAVRDLEGEAPMMRAALMLMNSRNLAKREYRETPVKLNRQRARHGKPPLLDYTHVRVKLSRALAARAGAAADPRNPSRLHLVSGHFKVRKTGVYWWSPHPRGRPDQGAIREQKRHVTV